MSNKFLNLNIKLINNRYKLQTWYYNPCVSVSATLLGGSADIRGFCLKAKGRWYGKKKAW